MPAYYRSLDDPALAVMASGAKARGRCLLVFVAGESQNELPSLMATLSRAGVPALGGVFYRVIFGTVLHETGCVVTEFDHLFDPSIIAREPGVRLSVEHLPPPESLPSDTTAFLFVDGSTPRATELVTAVYDRYGDRVRYLGAGTGLTASKGPKGPWSFATGHALQLGGAAIAFCGKPVSVAMAHGYRRVHGPLVATRVEGDVVKEINWQPAVDVYRAVVETELGKPIPRERWQLLDTVGFPFGITKEDAEDLVRLPIAVDDDGGLVCIGGIHNNCVLHILRGEPDRLVEAARQAAYRCASELGTAEQKLVIDCVSRYLFMRPDYEQELQVVEAELSKLGDATIVGALSEGEIASMGVSFLEILNKAVVVGAIGA